MHTMGCCWSFVTIMGAFTLVMAIVSVATPVWVQANGSNVTLGLWERCNDTQQCVRIPESTVEPYLKVVRAFHILGIITLGLSLVAGGYLMLFDEGEGDSIEILVGSFTIAVDKLLLITFSIELSCFLISMAAYANLGPTIGYSYGYSYTLGWVVFAMGAFLSLSVTYISFALATLVRYDNDDDC